MAEKKKRVYRNWTEVVERFRASGRSARDFCAAEGIAPPLFYKWRRRLEGGDTGRVLRAKAASWSWAAKRKAGRA